MRGDFMKTINLFLLTLIALMLTVGSVQAKSKFKIATVAPDGTPWAVLLNTYKKKISKKSKKELYPRVYLNGVKGDEQSIVRQIYKGSLQMGGVSTGALAVIVPDIELLELPYAFKDAKTADRVLDEVRPLVNALLEEKGLMLVMYSENGYRSMGTKDKCIRSPKDLVAMKMRSQESEVHLATYRALGASPAAISVGEVLSSLQTGVVSGFDNTPLFAQAVGWSQAVKYFSTTRHIYQPALIIANKAWFDALSPEFQKLIVEEGLKLEKKGRKMVRALEPALMANFTNSGIEVCDLTDAEREEFRKATAPVWSQRGAKATPTGKKLIEAIKKAQ
jgi:TRAP-type C4-dicarboxylate transport system substrate-binding protein